MAVTVTCWPAALLEVMPESVIASPKMPTFRDVAIVTDLAFGVTFTVPANPVAVGSLYANVPAFGNEHEPL